MQTMQGKGVRNIFEPVRQATFTLGTIETFAESAARNHWTGRSEVLLFSELEANAALAEKTGFAEGTACLLYTSARRNRIRSARIKHADPGGSSNHDRFPQEMCIRDRFTMTRWMSTFAKHIWTRMSFTA